MERQSSVAGFIKMKRLVFIFIALFCLLHMARDYYQLKDGYNYAWFTSFGHFWRAPQYEKQGMVVFFIAGLLCLYLGYRYAT
jgi:hypothetical protein